MLKTRIAMLDIAYFLIDRFDYQRMNVINQDLDMWLISKTSSKYPIIRLTGFSLAEGLRQKEAILMQTQQMTNLLNIKQEVLCIHFNTIEQTEVQADNYKQSLITETYITPFLKQDFKGIEHSVKKIGDDLEKELKRRELKILDLDSKPKKKGKLTLSMIGPTQIIIALNVLVFIIAAFLKQDFGDSLTAIVLGGMYKNLVYGANEWWRIISSGFLHVDVFHIMMNMVVLFQAGAIVEKVYGKRNMVIIYMTAIITSSLLALVMMDGGTISLGASGGVFGLMGAIIVYLFSANLHKVPKIRSQIISTLFANLLISLIPGISFWGHLGGFIGGVLISVALSNAKSLKLAKIHAYISTAMVVVLLFGYALFMDDNVYNIRPQVDKLSIQAYREIGLDKHANKLEVKLKTYYKSIGEKYE